MSSERKHIFESAFPSENEQQKNQTNILGIAKAMAEQWTKE